MKSANNIGFGIIGLGMIAEFHAKAIENIEGCIRIWEIFWQIPTSIL